MAEEVMHNIKVELAGREYPLTVLPSEETVVRALVDELNQEFDALLKRYVNKLNKQDILAMLLMTYAKKLHDAAPSQAQHTVIEYRIDQLETLLDEALSK